jgi:pimeloyl-ACP methyl ester carboxylesterase
VRQVEPSDGTRPPILLVHGAANSAAVWRFWLRDLAARGWSAQAIDLRGHGSGPPADLATTRMQDYADDVAAVAARCAMTPIVIGWSMGGLVAMLVAARGLATACVGLAPSEPAVRQDPSRPVRAGVFDSAEYGITSADLRHQPAMPDLDLEERTIALGSLGLESRLARDERKRGIVVTTLPCRLLIVTGALDADRQPASYADLHLPAEILSVEACSHWGLVLNRRALIHLVPAVTHWLTQVIADAP